MQTQNTDTYLTGIVYKKMLGHYDVQNNNQITNCSLSAKLWKDFSTTELSEDPGRRVTRVSEKHMDPIAIGDHVQFIKTEDGSGMIIDLFPRRNYIARGSAKPMPGAHAFEQVIAANIDQVIPVFAAADPEPRWHMLDRYLVAAESYAIPSRIVITKFDLVQGTSAESKLNTWIELYESIGYRVIVTSVKTSEGLDNLRQNLADRHSVLVGKSGVGKTSLLNALEPGLGLRVKTVNQSTGKGRHTTSHLEMFPLQCGGALIDTPGVREFGIYGLESTDVAAFFPEMTLILGQCKFGLSCQHDEEPGCAVRQGVMDGRISPYRYQSYLRMKDDL
jgi:ribosome biogenesis GTPase